MDLSHKGSGEIFDLKEMLLPFLHDPEQYLQPMDGSVQKAFLTRIQQHTGKPRWTNPPARWLKKSCRCY
jgi:hypothetical protein